jgi:hypothetical protein
MMAMLITSDVSSRNPMTRTTPSDSRRVVRKTTMPLREGLATTPQNWFSDACICANTVVAPNSSAPAPSSVGSRPASSMRERSTAFCSHAAASSPT